MAPREVFYESFRIAELMLHVHRLLENDGVKTQGDLVQGLRPLVGASSEEEIQVILNPIFLGCIRASADLPPSTLKRDSLANLLRQAVVSACTAYETFLLAELSDRLELVMQVKQRDFLPTHDDVKGYFTELTFNLSDVARMMTTEDNILFLKQKILGFVGFKNLGSIKGLSIVGYLLGVEAPWKDVAQKLKLEPEEIKKRVNACIERRNDIVHRADKPAGDGSLEKQEIEYAWTKLTVDTVGAVCLALDELIVSRKSDFTAILKARQEENDPHINKETEMNQPLNGSSGVING